MIGQTFTRLTVVSEAPKAHRKRRWHCSCSCGGSTTAYQWSLLAGRSRSCGCLKGEELSKLQVNRLHGLSKSPEYRTWSLMKARCYNPKYRSYSKYGGAGIRVCEEWRYSFTAFFHDIGCRPSPYHTLERLDERRAFSPSNCRWARTRVSKPKAVPHEENLLPLYFDILDPTELPLL